MKRSELNRHGAVSRRSPEKEEGGTGGYVVGRLSSNPR